MKSFMRVPTRTMSSNLPLEESIEIEEQKRLLKLIRSRGQIPTVPECDGYHVPHLADIQGDVLFRFPKHHQCFVFFRITDKVKFKKALDEFRSKVTSALDVKRNMLEISTKKDEKIKAARKAAPKGQLFDSRNIKLEEKDGIPLTQYLIAFSRAGLDELVGKDAKTGDKRFDDHCMLKDKAYLGDQSNWRLPFAKPGKNDQGKDIEVSTGLHGVISIATYKVAACKEGVDYVKNVFKDSCKIGTEDLTLQGNARPNQYRGHEHFGFLDGVSQPSIRDIEHPLPGQTEVDAGVIVMGYPGDTVPKSKRPEWAKGGTMMVVRKLQQDVLAFDAYCEKNGSRWKEFIPGGENNEAKLGVDPKLPEDERQRQLNQVGAELFAARFLGRWKSGAPIPLTPFQDDPELGRDPKRNNDFDYSVHGVEGQSSQEPSDFYCPFTAHARKMVPRNLGPYFSRKHLAGSSIVRAGIPYGPEVNSEERAKWKAEKEKDPSKYIEETDRGLLFCCYASNLDAGFVRQTTGYGNNDFFPTTSIFPTKHGQDPIIGGPPAKDSSQVPREVIPIAPGTTPGEVIIADATYTVSNNDQVNYRVEVKGVGNKKTFEVSGFAQEVPENLPPGADNPFFVTSRGGEYFFVPSIPTLKSWAV
ncbi:unnamed protein product [Rhizoctonia solani]|uniref:DyP dimeric alpha+beta barrel domain-containing protein n=1 Tax=Rhizoctonia solani TaxID=456999 RepID=A0A8H3GQS4_9AGAM|nr:unnamed protein product [Rhizoctonia solani]